MSERHGFEDLTKDFTPERRARADARKAELRAAMPLHALRQARAMTRKAVGEVLKIEQPAVAKLERRADMYVSNLRSSIEAMGGRLNIVAEFPEDSVVITTFSDAGEDGEARSPPQHVISTGAQRSGEISCQPPDISPLGTHHAGGYDGRRNRLKDAAVRVYEVPQRAQEAAMRTSIDIDDKLMEEALKASGCKTKKAAVKEGLRLLVRARKQLRTRTRRGKLRWEDTLDEMRRDR